MPRKYNGRLSLRQLVHQNTRPIYAVVLTATLLECPMLFVIICAGVIVWKVATLRVPDEFKHWQ